jgi:signal transduction histidine kinase
MLMRVIPDVPLRRIFATVLVAAATLTCMADETNALAIRSVVVNDRTIPIANGGPINLGASPLNIVFQYDAEKNAVNPPLRMRYMLEAYENTWHETGGVMEFYIRFYNHAGDLIGNIPYPISGESTRWTGSLINSELTHRRESFIVPPQAERLVVVISSAGPPDSVGIYVVANLVVTTTNGALVLRSPFDNETAAHASDDPPANWMRDGIVHSIARVVKIGRDPQTRAFAVLDENLESHGEWHNMLETAPLVTPGEELVAEWNEMFSTGLGLSHTARYDNLPPGNYRLRVAGLDVYGRPTGQECSLNIFVPQPFWKTQWFWTVIVLGATILILSASRYFVWHKMRREMQQLKQQRALEQERVRIAHDIHDDLGARVTQISLLSAMSEKNETFPEKARADFDRISKMSRELVSALYETVWAVSPENDNLEALGSYICQLANKMCEQTPVRCRFQVSGLPTEVQLSSQSRHNICMTVKEAIHNVIKHAQATEISVRITFVRGKLAASIHDNGTGFNPANETHGNGLVNMQQRMTNIGGQCVIESEPGKGTVVHIHLVVPEAVKIS